MGQPVGPDVAAVAAGASLGLELGVHAVSAAAEPTSTDVCAVSDGILISSSIRAGRCFVQLAPSRFVYSF